MSRKNLNAEIQAMLRDRPHQAHDAITDFIRFCLLAAGWRPLPEIATVLGTGNLLCVVEGVLPVYRSDFAGEEDGRNILERRVRTAVEIRDAVIAEDRPVDVLEVRSGVVAVRIHEVLARLRRLLEGCQEPEPTQPVPATSPESCLDMKIVHEILSAADGPPGPVQTAHWDDIGYTTLYRLSPGKVSVSFECYQVTGWEGDDGGPPRWYGGGDRPIVGEAEGAPVWGDARVRPHLHGDIKWDGCSDWSFPEQIEENTMLHFCGRGRALAVAVLLDRCYTLAKELMGPAVSDPSLFEGGRVAVRLEVTEQ